MRQYLHWYPRLAKSAQDLQYKHGVQVMSVPNPGDIKRRDNSLAGEPETALRKVIGSNIINFEGRIGLRPLRFERIFIFSSIWQPKEVTIVIRIARWLNIRFP
eukprot:gb/GEZJ01004332.1/.p1 GENE.gb/GEZJ01004332.1/~~gb/GEZJ01004332.1/.p1  ORF type:complete len:103 (+),score=7.25 gb/GEZJ01004332.1/:1887-2195(+)